MGVVNRGVDYLFSILQLSFLIIPSGEFDSQGAALRT
jgi:hypothetical protein